MKLKLSTILIAALCTSFTTYAQKATKVTSPEGDVYAAISSDGMPKGYETRNSPNLYYEAPLYTYIATASQTTEMIKDENGNHLYAKRIVRHQSKSLSYRSDGSGNWVSKSYNPNQFVSTLFAVAPVDIYSDGATTSGSGNSKTMNWATASGFLLTGNSLDIINEVSATPMGCSMYRGKSGKDPIGTWRLPVQKEMALIAILYNPLLAQSGDTGFTPLVEKAGYWTATESSRTNSYYLYTDTYGVNVLDKNSKYYVRCVRDITSTR